MSQHTIDTATISVSIATIVTSYVTKKMNLSMTENCAVLSIISYLINSLWLKEFDINFNMFSQNIIFLCFVIIIIICVTCIIFHKYLYDIYGQLKYLNNYKLNLYGGNAIGTFLSYVKLNKNFYDLPQSWDINRDSLFDNTNIMMELVGHTNHASPNYKINFNDTRFNVRGHYIINHIDNPNKVDSLTPNTLAQISHKPQNSETNFKYILFITICITSSGIIPNEYFEKIAKSVSDAEELQKLSGKINLYYFRLFSNNERIRYSHFNFYSGIKQPMSSLEKKYIDNFYCENKEKLWKRVKFVSDTNSNLYESGQNPQLGLLLYGPPGCGKSCFIHRIAMTLQRHIISLDILSLRTRENIINTLQNPYIGYFNKFLSPRDVIFVLDEFDITVLALQKAQLERENIKKIIFENAISKSTDDSKNDKHGVIPQLNDDCVTINDLLTIFQGPVPLDGAIIIATTNKYEEINEICPALFRPGRLTPVFFGYPTAEILDEISQQYFKQPLNVSTEYISAVCTSKIMEFVTEALLEEKDKFGYFKTHVEKCLIKKNSTRKN